MNTLYDFIVIGAGPAGLAAAATAREHGLSTLVLDEQAEPGGQIYRAVERADARHVAAFGEDYRRGQDLVQEFRASGAQYRPGATVWNVDRDLTVSIVADGRATQVRGKRLLIATGAMERPVAIPGWTLPGVMGAGAADVLLKSAQMVPSGRVVLAGSGPLLLLVACHMLEHGVQVRALLETTKFSDYLKALPEIPGALKKSDYLLRGLSMRRQIRKAGIPTYQGVRDLEALGAGKVEKVRFTCGGDSRELAVDTLLVHEGVVPSTQITRMLNCEHAWDEVQRYWHPVVDAWGNTSASGVAVAGDGGRVCGAKTAEAAGRLAALDAACRLKGLSRQQRDWAARPHQQLQAEEGAIRPFLNRLFPPNPQALVPPQDETLVCRCEEITAGQIRHSVAMGNHAPGPVKVHTRSGMGPCQGRMCGLTIAEIIADCLKVSVPDVDYFNIRPPVKPVTLGQIAELELCS